MIENVKIMIIQALKFKFYQYFVFTKKYSIDLSHLPHFDLSHLCQFNLYVLFVVENELVTIEIFLPDFSGGQKCVTAGWQFLLIFLKRVEKDPFLRPQIRAKDTFS